MTMPIRNIIADLEFQLKEAIAMSEYHVGKFKDWEQTIIKLKESIETLWNLLIEN